MLYSDTLLILGAGASHEVGLPTGAILSTEISQRLQFSVDTLGKISGGDSQILQVLRQTALQENVGIADYFDAACAVSKGVKYSRSIDEFINKHKDNKRIQFCAKLAIARIIVEAEKNSYVYVDERRGEWPKCTALLSEYSRILSKA